MKRTKLVLIAGMPSRQFKPSHHVLEHLTFQAWVELLGTPASDYNFDEIVANFLSRKSFSVQDVLSAFRFIERRAIGADSLTIPLHILWCADSPRGATFRKALQSALTQNLAAALEFLQLKTREQLAELENEDVELALSTAQKDLTWCAKQSTHQETLALLKIVAN